MEILHDVDPRFGVAFRDDRGTHPVIRLPRNDSLRILPKSGMSEIYDSLVACELLSGKSLDRGDSRRVYCDGDDGGAPMYSCLGVLAARTGGVIDLKKCYSALPRPFKKISTSTFIYPQPQPTPQDVLKDSSMANCFAIGHKILTTKTSKKFSVNL